MHFLSISAAVVGHFLVSIQFDQAADIPKLCFLLGICLSLCGDTKNERTYVPFWLELLKDAFISFVVVEIGIVVIWAIIEKIITYALSTVRENAETTIIKMDKIDILLTIVAIIFLFKQALLLLKEAVESANQRLNSRF